MGVGAGGALALPGALSPVPPAVPSAPNPVLSSGGIEPRSGSLPFSHEVHSDSDEGSFGLNLGSKIRQALTEARSGDTFLIVECFRYRCSGFRRGAVTGRFLGSCDVPPFRQEVTIQFHVVKKMGDDAYSVVAWSSQPYPAEIAGQRVLDHAPAWALEEAESAALIEKTQTSLWTFAVLEHRLGVGTSPELRCLKLRNGLELPGRIRATTRRRPGALRQFGDTDDCPAPPSGTDLANRPGLFDRRRLILRVFVGLVYVAARLVVGAL